MHTDPGGGSRQGNLLGALALAVNDRVALALEDLPVSSASDAAVLVSLAGYLDGHPIESLRVPVGLSHSATVRLIDRLSEAGLVRRTTTPDDARAVAVQLTASGRRVAERIAAARAEALEAALADLGTGARDELTGHLETILATLTSTTAGARRTCRLCDIEVCGHNDGHCPVTNAAAQRKGDGDG